MHSIKRLIGLLLASALAAASCASGSDPETTSPTTLATSDDAGLVATTLADDDVASGDTIEVEDDDNEDDDGPGSDYLFDQELLHTFELELSEEDLAFLDADPAREEYVEGTLTFEGETIPVGIRYKGSIGAFAFCLDGATPFTPEGAKTCPKLSMKIKINWNDSNDEFLGVRKLQFHSMNRDDSQLRERLGYWLWREMGVAAPRATHARVLINGEFAGLFALIENIDGRFTRHNFDDGTGNLYKEVWPLSEDGAPFDDDIYIDSLRTNEDEDPTADLIRSFAAALAAESDDSARADVVRDFMEIEPLMSQLAVDRAISHDDGPFHWYCLPNVARNGDCGPHNFFWYEEPQTEQLHLIPWDIDNSFAPNNGLGGFITVADQLGEITNDCEPFPFGTFNLPQISASCDPLFAAWATMESEYDAAFDRLHDGPLRAEVIDPLLDAWIAQIEDATAEAADADPDALTLQSWRSGVDQLREIIATARENRPA